MIIRSILLFFFLLVSLSFPISSSSSNKSREEKTLAMIKPDGLLGNYTERIKEVILQSGFSIVTEIITQLDEDRASIFYAEHSSKSFFSSLIKYMTRLSKGYKQLLVLAMVLKKENAVSDWRTLIGPTDARKAKITHPDSVRAMCGLDSERNCVHGSDSLESAQREVSFFFRELSSGEAVRVHDEL
ncbi:probable nucleoside diphosphate kinase 5 isoform X2 [Ricinus communis]|uniref:probable nucleoside diphosphate kinase 5 isoform X2 n=1 Tax=Ricinus communis TaxID=3988 RepID=UPI00201ABA28|nr:probable nucleoside diphosphate kinase 5 isoform X2 [Ricinus communis]